MRPEYLIRGRWQELIAGSLDQPAQEEVIATVNVKALGLENMELAVVKALDLRRENGGRHRGRMQRLLDLEDLALETLEKVLEGRQEVTTGQLPQLRDTAEQLIESCLADPHVSQIEKETIQRLLEKNLSSC